MPRYIEGQDRSQTVMLPECLDDFIGQDNPVRVVDTFVDELDLAKLDFENTLPAATGRPLITRRFCSRSTSTATSIASSPAAGWRPRLDVTSN